MVRSSCCDKLNVRRGPWTVEEDAKILAYVSKHGTGNWTAVPKKAGLRRCSKSCRLRWTNYLRPDLKHDSFTPQEEEMVIKLHAAIGSRWSIIAQQLPGRTDNDVKNYWNTKLRKKLSEMGIDPVTHKPFSQILANYGNISGFPKSRARIGSLNRDLKNALVPKPEPYSSQPPEGIPNINSHWMAPKMEPVQDCFFNDNDTNKNHSFDLLDQLQAIKMVTEASGCTKYETISPHFLNESSPSSAASSSSSSTCSTAAQEKMPLGFSWQEFLLEDAFLQSDLHEQQNTEELYSKDTASQGKNVMPKSRENMTQQGQLNCRMTITNHDAGVEGMDPAVTISNGFQFPSTMNTSHDSFVEAILDGENEMFLDFPGLLEEPFYT